MPNIKIYINEILLQDRRVAIQSALLPIRDMLCRELKVETSACQFAIISFVGMDDLPQINAELSILPKPNRNREVVVEICSKLQHMIAEVTHTPVAVRATTLDPQTYVALK